MKKTSSKAQKPVAYDHKKIEKKWQKYWESKKLNRATEDAKKKKFYGLIEFPYPSGDGLHVGHIRSNTAMDVIARKRRAEGYNVLYPIGWDAFGLPTENYAIKTGIQPAIVTKKNTDTFRRQLKALGFSFDWSREVDTTDPAYYKWTQWIFLQLYKKGLAYKKKMTINWCPKDLIGLANEEVVDGKCERCGTPVEKREKEQWMLAITKYADRLDKDLDTVDFLERIKIQQRNWIGKSEGAQIRFGIQDSGGKNNLEKEVEVFTTRPDTLFGVTYMVLAPEHPLVKEFITTLENRSEVESYISKVKNETDIERTDAKKEKTGVELKGIKAINPANNKEIPVWIADYVLADYGTGAVMAVPAHDERDWEFAKKYGLRIKDVVMPIRIDHSNPHRDGKKTIERKAIQAIIRNPKTGKILCLKWKKQPWTTFIVGGVEEGEDVVDAARREILEETGLKQLKFIKVLGGPVKSEFFAAHKDENRVAYFNVVVFETEGDEQLSISTEELEKHEPVWLDLKDIRPDTMQCGELDIWLSRLNNDNMACIESGILINSGKFNGRDSATVKKEITESVGGTWITTYKLRDWIFSRQRYWGEPIPMVHCDRCGIVPVPEKDLPIKLPAVKNYKPTETGESPLAAISKWVNTKCPQCVADKKKPKYLIFDFDGVLGDTFDASLDVRVKMGAKDRVEALKILEKYFDNKPHHTRDTPRTVEQIERDVTYTKKYASIILENEVKLFKEFIAEIKKYKNAKMAVVSSGSGDYVKPALKNSGLKFTHVLAFEESHSKEEKIELICKDWGIDVKDVYYFTDTKADIYELENFMDRSKLIGCAWGWGGYDKLRELLPERQILSSFKDIHKFFNTDCSARRETDTMPNWAGSSWYYLRYVDPKNKKAFADPKNLKYWTPVDWYNGGMEHTTLHLLYSRFWHKFLFDLGLVPTSEPYQKRTSHGLILAEGGVKMSKSKGNVINPDGIVETVGADSLRLYEMFMGPFDQPIAWDTNNIAGVRRFIERVWKLRERVIQKTDEKVGDFVLVNKIIHKSIKKVSDDIEAMRFNTAISSLMIALNELEKVEAIDDEQYGTFLQLLAPFAPHVTDELWSMLGNKSSIHTVSWPVYDPVLATDSEVTIMVQINGKIRSSFTSPIDTVKEELERLAKATPEAEKWLSGKEIKKVIVVPNKLVNIVVA